MSTVLTLLSVQALLGALDNFWHHELQARLPQCTGARRELALHALREAMYGVLFFGLAWWRWLGWCALLLTALLVCEVIVTLLDFLEEDRSRRLPAAERVLHTVLALGYGAFIGLFAPVAWRWFLQPSGWVPVSYGALSGLLTLFAAGVLAWALRNAMAARRLFHRAAAQAADSAVPAATGPAVLVAGGTGFVGSGLVRQLLRDGRRVIVLSRDALRARALLGPQVWVVERLDDIPPDTAIAAVVNLAGATVLGAPWTPARRQLLIRSRVDTTAALITLMRRLAQRPAVFVAASAVGYYGVPAGEAPLDERAPPQPGRFQSDLCVAIEHEARRAEALGLRVVRLRFGIVLGAEGGAYPPQALAARWGLGAVLGDGRQPVPWIHHDDAIGLIRFAIDTPALSGAVNAVAPQLPKQAEFAAALATSFGRRVWLRMPAAPLRLLMGEMSELLLCGQPVRPMAAQAAGYRFRHATLEEAARALAAATRAG
ncbi:TIGR01777 family oxidoreductase [Aquabacterium sp.]|uniref:TIGR01777 family oxidoreductase n=1 Tax=Aquabacterium sp. TaxID=1872578 RepID=UPI002B62F422|nr:TIGR01777 family oxidoreductase [Aquabacterium sp.]HSW06715.1 TIGR01777 family oxidoreductase [Aquabacterium sp.]